MQPDRYGTGSRDLHREIPYLREGVRIVRSGLVFRMHEYFHKPIGPASETRRPAAAKGDPMSRQIARTSGGDPVKSVDAPAEMTPKPSPSEQDVAELAYQRWVERGCPQGCPEEDWFEAEHELQSRGHSS